MGDRGEVYIKDENVRLYTHWDAEELIKTVKRALSKKWRWDDAHYLGRIIFDEMIGNNQGTETGFGISTGQTDAWRIIQIDCENQTVSIEEYEKFVLKDQSFEEFIK